MRYKQRTGQHTLAREKTETDNLYVTNVTDERKRIVRFTVDYARKIGFFCI